MPTLADIYSAADSFKRRLSDVVSNPLTSAQQMLGYANDRARMLNQQMAEAASQPEFISPQDRVMAAKLAESYNPAGMTTPISKSLSGKYPNVTLDVFESPKAIDLSRIFVPKEMRGQGIGSSVMQELTDYADQTGKQVRLTPSAEFGGNVERLKQFYKNFGFVENKGKNKDFTTREAMFRNPQIQEVQDTSYRGSHSAPGPDFGAPLHDLTGGGQMYPSDVYAESAARIYGTGYPKADREAFALAKQVRNKPDAEVTMYRAVPKDENIKDINKGDWVTLSKSYAKNHGEAVLGDDYKILSKKVKAKDLWTNADSIHEFGYHPQ
jgi:GNAT superfamily N-acetyltransferase